MRRCVIKGLHCILFYLLKGFWYWPAYKVSVLIALSSKKGSGESAYLGRFTRAFSACLHKYGCRQRLRPKFLKDDFLKNAEGAVTRHVKS